MSDYSDSTEKDLVGNYVYVNGQMVANLMDYADGVRYFLTDHLGSVIGTVKDNGNLQNKYQYLPYGELFQSYVSDANHFGYTGQETETELSSEWTYHGARVPHPLAVGFVRLLDGHLLLYLAQVT